MLKTITSTQNKEVKWLLQLQEKSRNRRKERLFVVEGQREIELALKGLFKPVNLYFVAELIAYEKVVEIARSSQAEPAEIIEINDEVYSKLAYRSGTEGLIGVFRSKENRLQQ